MVTFLGWLAANALVVAVLIPAVWLSCRLLRSRPAAQHLLWFLLLIKLITPPVLQWPWRVEAVMTSWMGSREPQAEALSNVSSVLPAEAPRDRAMELAADQTNRAPLLTAPPIAGELVQPAHALPAQSYSVPNVALFVWTIGALMLLAFTIRGLLRQRRIVRTASPAPAYLLSEVDRVARRLRLRPPKAAVSAQIATPVLCCLGRPRLLWPASMSKPEAVAHCDGIVAHELAHLARRDHYFLYAELVVAVCCWWNPLMWVIRRHLRETRELACDAMALTAVEQPRCDYARRLLALSVAPPDSLILAPAFGAGILSRRFLKRRLTMVFDERTDGHVSLAGVALAAVLIAVGLPGLTLADPQTEPAGGSADSSSAEATQSSASSATGSADADLANPEPTRSRFARSFRISKVVKTAEISNDKPAEIKLGSGGIIRISKNDQGDLVVTVEQNEAGELPPLRKAEGLGSFRSELDPRGAGGASAGFSARRRSGGGSASSFGTTVRQNVVRESGSSDSRPDIDRQLLQSDVELAEVGLREKQAELKIANKANADPERLELAELALRRAQIELNRARLRLSRSEATGTGTKP